MPATNFNAPVYASTNPAVADLFRNEFAQRQAQQAAYEALAAQDTRRQEIAAQDRLAQAQMKNAQEQQNYNNLFRIAEFKDRQQGGDEQRALLNRQLDIEQKYKEGLVQKPANRTAADIEAFNTDSETIANQLQAAYDTKLAVGKAAAKKAYDDAMSKVGYFGIGTFGTEKAKKDYEQVLSTLEDNIFNQVQDLAGRYYPPASFRVDPFNKKFLPVGTRKANTTASPTGQDAGGSPVPFNMNGGSVTGESADQGTGEGSTPYTMIRPTGEIQQFPTRDAMNAAAAPALSASIPSPATPTVVPGGQLVRVKVPGGLLELPSNLADAAEQQLRSGTASSVVLGQLLKSGQARLLPDTTMTPTQSLPPIPLGY